MSDNTDRSEQMGEAVAWMYEHPKWPAEIKLYRSDFPFGERAERGWSETPLYTRTPAQAAPVSGESAKLTSEYLAMTPLQKWDTLALHGLLGTDEPWIEDMRQTLRDLATPPASASQAKCDGQGWVFWSPDSGEEYAPNHPVESGECPEAEIIRKSTAQEDVLWQAFQAEFQRAHDLSKMEASASQVEAVARGARMSFPQGDFMDVEAIFGSAGLIHLTQGNAQLTVVAEQAVPFANALLGFARAALQAERPTE